MTNIKHLLKKYSQSYVPGEQRTAHYNKKIKQNENRKNRHLVLDYLLNETPFTLNKTQTRQIRYWIDTFHPYWKTLHRQSSDETIILAMIMIQQKNTDSRLQVEKYKISRKYQLTSPKFELIQNNLIFLLMKTTPLTYNQSQYYLKETLENKDS